MKKYLLSLFCLALLLGSKSLMAQESYHCGSTAFQEQIDLLHPEAAHARAAIEAHTERYVAEQGQQAGGERVVYTIPVVVHVVYNTTAENISDAQILSQIEALNRDFRKTNTDVSQIPTAFASLASDSELEFCLAQRDPNGNATSGITRTSTTQTSFTTDGGVMSSTTGGKNIWNRNQYLNIYVCDLAPAGLGGYAQLPGGPSSTDAVVIDYTVFGTSGNVSYPYNKGRTAVHEVGHWFNLLHTWGDSNCGTDLVSDTPIQQTANQSCPTFPHVTCSNGPNGDMFMNYMDYPWDVCKFLFTAGQKTRMRAVLSSGGARSSLLNSPACVPVVSSCGTPTGLTATNISSSSALLGWTAVSGANSYQIQGRKVGSTTWSNLTSTTNSKQLGSVLQACKQYEFKVQAVCGTLTSAYSSTASFTTSGCMGVAPTIETNPNYDDALWLSYEGMQLLPNPAQDFVSISYGLPANCSAAELHLIGIDGRVLRQVPLNTDNLLNQVSVDIHDLAVGYYMVALKCNTGQSFREKLVIVR